MGKLNNKVALVTGGASGIGEAIALMFAKEGADICIADKNLDGAKATAREVKRIGRKSLAVRVDLARFPDLDKLVNSMIKHFGGIDILVNDAGVVSMSPFLEVTKDDWDAVFNVNIRGLFFITQRVLPYMLKQGKGKVINIASNWGAIGYRNASVYAASKAAVINLTKTLALEFAPNKINVNAIGPAATETTLTKKFFMENPEALQHFLKEIPLARLAQPEDMAAAAVYLASDESDFVTGHTLFVDGGFLSQ